MLQLCISPGHSRTILTFKTNISLHLLSSNFSPPITNDKFWCGLSYIASRDFTLQQEHHVAISIFTHLHDGKIMVNQESQSNRWNDQKLRPKCVMIGVVSGLEFEED